MRFALISFFLTSALFAGATAFISVIAIVSEALHLSSEALHLNRGAAVVRFDAYAPPVYAPQRTPLPVSDVMQLIDAAATKHNVPADFLRSIMAAESNFNSEAVSVRGAIGLMQLMPGTARIFGADPGVPDQNVDAGASYLRVLMDRYRHYRNSLPRVIAAYNAGPDMVDRYRGIPPFRETRIYVRRVLAFLAQFRRIQAAERFSP